MHDRQIQAMQLAEAMQRAELVQRAEAMQRAALAQAVGTKVVIDLTDEPAPQPTARVKRERSPSPAREEVIISENNTRQQQQATSAVSAAQPRVKRERKSIDARPTHRTGPHAIIADTHPTVITLPDTEGAVELRCDLCGGNSRANGGGWIKGLRGFNGHFRNCHRGLLADDEYYSRESVIQRCTVHRLSQQEVDAVQAGDLNAYHVKMIPGAGRDHAAGMGHYDERGPGIKPAPFDPNPYGRSAGE